MHLCINSILEVLFSQIRLSISHGQSQSRQPNNFTAAKIQGLNKEEISQPEIVIVSSYFFDSQHIHLE